MNPFLKSRESADYRPLRSTELRASDGLEAYIHIRGFLVLGEFASAESWFAEYRKEQLLIGFVSEFLAIQIRLYQGGSAQEALDACSYLTTQLPNDDYLQGEWFFVLGFAQTNVGSYVQSLASSRKALIWYERANLWVLAALSQFNLYISLDCLGRHNEMHDVFFSLKRRLEESDSAVVKLHVGLLELSLAINNEDFESAAAVSRSLTDIAVDLGRWRDLGTILALSSYALAKTNDTCSLIQIQETIRKFQSHFTSDLKIVLKAFYDVAERPLITAAQAENLFNYWKNIKHPVYRLNLCDLLLEQCSLSLAWGMALRLADRAIKVAIKYQQPDRLTDFSFHRCRALLMLGHYEKAKAQIEQYRRTALTGGLSARILKYQQLKQLYETTTASLNLKSSQPIVQLNPDEHSISINRCNVDLKQSPLLWRALLILERFPAGISISDFHKKLYDVDYHALRHERRISGLLMRLRDLLGGAETVVRQESRIIMKCSLLSNRSSERRQGRLQQLIHIIREHDTPVSISDIEKHFTETRRMLQFDLQKLAKDGVLHTIGSTKSKKYFMKNLAL